MSDPDDEEFLESAMRWLWDVGAIPRHPGSTWNREPRALAFRVVVDLDARLEGARTAYAQARSTLTGSAHDIDGVLAEIEAEGARLQRWAREARLVAEALGGRRWDERL
ncbi:MAG: hypothetical protein ACO3ID_02425 [Candidatus Nanopelagicales bacterium]